MSVEEVSQFLQRNDEQLERLVELSVQFAKNQEDRVALPKDHYSEEDLAKYELFAKIFRSNVSSFDYHSAPVNDIKFNVENLLPELAKIELREIYKKDFSEEKRPPYQAHLKPAPISQGNPARVILCVSFGVTS